MDGLGFEIEQEYCAISEERLAHVDKENEQMSLFQIIEGADKE